MGALSQFRGLPKQVYYLSVIRVIMALGSLVFPFLSLMMTSYLGFNEFQSGCVMIFVSAGNIIGSFGGGKLGDMYGRKTVFVTASVVAIFMAFMAGFLAPSIYMLPCILLSYFASSLVMPVVAAMITDNSDETNRAECFSILFLTQNIGYAIGPSVGGMLYYSHMKWIFYGEAIMYSIAIIIAIFMIRDVYDIPTKEERLALKLANQQNQKVAGGENTFALLLKMPILLGFILILALLTACYQEIGFVLPMQFEDMIGAELGSKYAGYIWTANGLTIVFATPLIISLSKRRNQLKNVMVASALYAVGFGLNGYIDWPFGILLVAVIWSAGEILISTGAGVFIASYSPETHRARFQSLYEVARGLGRGIGPTICGWYLLTHNYRQMWTMVALVCIVMMGGVYLLYRAQQKEAKV
ncbi:MAG: MFS transporter [Firmicutes bacterium]|nr:MFS transporter [Bacillota bacterium]